MKYCPGCGTPLPDDAKFCGRCATRLPEQVEEKIPVQPPIQPPPVAPIYKPSPRPPMPLPRVKFKTPVIIGVIVVVVMVIAASAFFVLTKNEDGTTDGGGTSGGTTDSDGDGIPNVDDIDDDNDGYQDTEDYMPYKDAKIKITLKKFKVIDEVDLWSNEAQVYFKIEINDKYETRAPSETTYWSVTLGTLNTVNWEYTKNVPDNVQTHKIVISMWDDDGTFDDTLDIDGSDNTKGLTVQYNIQSGTWTGDDTDGITDGSYDGTQTSDDDDAYLEYDIVTV